jgi:hypothetical protein
VAAVTDRAALLLATLLLPLMSECEAYTHHAHMAAALQAEEVVKRQKEAKVSMQSHFD